MGSKLGSVRPAVNYTPTAIPIAISSSASFVNPIATDETVTFWNMAKAWPIVRLRAKEQNSARTY